MCQFMTTETSMTLAVTSQLHTLVYKPSPQRVGREQIHPRSTLHIFPKKDQERGLILQKLQCKDYFITLIKELHLPEMRKKQGRNNPNSLSFCPLSSFHCFFLPELHQAQNGKAKRHDLLGLKGHRTQQRGMERDLERKHRKQRMNPALPSHD